MKTEKNTLKEIVDRGNPNIPLYIYHHYSEKYMLYLHWHNEFEIIYVEKGSIIFVVDTVPIEISEGQCIVINSGQLHSAHHVNSELSIHHALLFDMNFLNSSTFDYCQSNYINPILSGHYRFPFVIDENTDWGAKIIEEIKETIKVYDSNFKGYELSLKSSLYKIISILLAEDKFLIDESTNHSNINYKINIIKKTLHYIQNNYSQKIYIEQLANNVNMNTQYFCRFFKKNIGKTPIDYINQYRIEQAVRIIKTEDKNISEICFEVGFQNFSYFIKKFKEYKNCTPSKYKVK